MYGMEHLCLRKVLKAPLSLKPYRNVSLCYKEHNRFEMLAVAFHTAATFDSVNLQTIELTGHSSTVCSCH